MNLPSNMPYNINANMQSDIKSDFKINNPIMWVGIAFIGSILVYKMYSKWAAGAEQRTLQKALDNLTQVDSSKLTINQSEAVIIADRLLTAMDGMGTDEDSVMNLLINTARTNDDLKLIVKTFGLKEYGTTGLPYWGSGTPLDLSGWIKKEMSGSNLTKLQTRFAQAGIPF